MTGEITLRGTVLPIGGLKEKVLAAHRAGIKKILIPAENEKDIEEIPASVLKGVELELVSHVDEVLKKALVLDDPEAYSATPRSSFSRKRRLRRLPTRSRKFPRAKFFPSKSRAIWRGNAG